MSRKYTERMSAAEFACWRHLLGLTLDELAHTLGVNPRTTRAWETGRDPIPHRVRDELATLKTEHDQLVEQYLNADGVIAITRDKDQPSPRPRGWHVAAAARAIADEPDLMVGWT